MRINNKKLSYRRMIMMSRRSPEIARCIICFKKPFRFVLAYMGVILVDYPITLVTRSDSKLLIESFHDLVTAWVIFCRVEYDLPRDARTILDIGANYGSFSIWASQTARGAQTIALEPFADTFNALSCNVRMNKLEGIVFCMQGALANTTGEVFNPIIQTDVPTQSRAFSGSSIFGRTDQSKVQTWSFIDLIEEACLRLRCDEIDFVKIDIEGMEHLVIDINSKRALKRIRRLGIEYHPNGDKLRLFKIFEDTGLVCYSDVAVARNSGVAQFARFQTQSRA